MSAGPGLSRQRSLSSRRIPPTQQQQTIPLPQSKGKQQAPFDAPFEPCAATGSSFLYAQGPSVICLHHDTLAIQRRFQKHAEDILFISVDNVSERGAGRLVVTYDVGQTAIVWDLMTGDQVARFASYEQIKVASWMRNGNIAFGNTKGEVILFEPSTSEHVSARTIYDPITALAPSSDCKTYAIGYNNGSILLAALQPTFTILHTLSTSRGPSPIATLSWHASSSKQKSDMLATQTSDGDLRVWSVVKPPSNEQPRVIRVLRRSEEFFPGRNWIAWSKNGRIIQFSEGETWSWDVRTKHVTYEPIQTVEHVRAVANYGPTASLFTLGPNHSIQQYDLETGEVVANTQHFPMTVPPTPPEEKQQFEYLTSSSTEDLNSPAGKSSAQEMFEAARQARNQMGSPQSYLSRGSEKSSSLQQRARYTPVVSPSGRTEQSVTNISVGTQSRMAPSAYGQPQQPSMSQYSPVSNRGRKGSKLKQEVLPSPETTPTLDLFPYTRARLNDVPYKPVRPGDEANLSTDSLRRQMLEVVFGWEEDAPELVRDELSRHPPASQNAILLAKWLNDDPEQMPNVLGSSAMSSQLDWMMLALSGMANHAASKKMGLNFVEKKLREGDIHAAAVILLTLGDRNDAIEVYLEANYYLEAVLLTCLLMPNDWDRLKYLVRKWGEYVVDKSQQYLAIRCFSCTDVEPAGEWTSPTAQMAATANPETIDFSQQSSQMHSDMHSDMQRRNFFTAPTPIAMMKPQTPMTLNPQQQQAQRGPLRLITSFGAEEHHILKFPGLKSDDRTPTVGHGVTPIAESAINDSALTPGGAGSYRLNNMRSINSALLSGRTATPGSFHRQRLPSIGETPIDSNPPQFPLATTPVNVPRSLPTPADSGSEKEKEKAQEKVIKLTTDEVPPIKEEKPTLTLSSARYEPSETPAKETPLTALAPSTAVKFSRTHDLNDLETTVPPPLGFEEKKSRSRGGSRSRKPDGLSIQMIPVHERERSDRSETTGDSPAYRSLHRSNTLNSTTTTQFDSHSEMTSPPTTGNSYYDVAPTTGSSFRSMTKSPGVTGRSIDQYISSLEQAQYYTKGSRSRTNGSQDGADRTPRKKSKTRDREDDRGRNERRAIPSSKRSPSSPVPMSPDDLSLYTAPSIESFDSIFEGEKQMEAENHRFREEKKSRANKPRSESRHEERQRNRSRSRHGEGRGKPASGHVSRRTTPEPFADPYARGRSISKLDGSTSRSPSSPLPMTSSMEDLRTPIEGALRLVSRNRERRDRSGSRRADRGTSSRREVSPDRRKRDGRSGSRKTSGDAPTDLPLSRRGSVSTRGERHRRRAPSIEQSGRLDRETLNSTLSPSMYDSSVYSSIAPEDSISQVSTVNPEYRAQSNPQFLDRRKKELAAAELEARRLSLARRPSAPSIPFPGQHNLHGKSASVDATPTLARSKTDFVPTLANINSFHDRIEARNSPRPAGSDSGSSGRGSNGPRRQGTPRAMRHPMQDSSIPDIPEGMATLLGSGSYRPTRATDPIPRSISAPPEKDESIRVPPSDLPKHPAFDMRIPNSRSSSKADENRRAMSRDRGRAMSRERGISKERKPYPRDENLPPPILPELQHLAMPPPPPPPPIHPGDFSQSLKLQTAFSPPVNSYTPSTVPLPQSEPPSASTHRRGRSGAESTGMFNGLRNLADRMRSTSRGRDTRSPPTEDTVSPYESIPLPPNFHQRVAAQTRSPVIPEEGLGTVAMSPPYESIPDGPPPMRGVGTMI